ACGVLSGGLNGEREWRKESDCGDVRATLRRREGLRVFCEQTRHAFIAALPDEVGFADGLLGKRRVEGETRGCSKQSSCNHSEYGPEPGGHGITSIAIRREEPLHRCRERLGLPWGPSLSRSARY